MVLVVDDDKDIRDVLAIALSMRNIPVLVAIDRDNAYMIFQRQPEISCILLDYNMPGMSIEEFISKCRGLNAGINIALLSAVNDVEGHAEKLGLKCWLAKPISDFEALYRLVESCEICQTFGRS
jgi:CheY-like chemotaxis protein